MSNRAETSAEEITTALVKTWSNTDLATALMFCAMVTGDVQAARVCKEAAERLSSSGEGVKRDQ